MGSQLSIENNTEDIYYCKIYDFSAVALTWSKFIVEKMLTIAENYPATEGIAAPMKLVFSEVTDQFMSMSGLTPLTAGEIFKYMSGKGAPDMKTALTTFYQTATIDKLLQDGYTKINPTDRLYSGSKTLSWLMSGDCKRVKTGWDYAKKRLYTFHDEAIMDPIATAPNDGGVQNHQITYWTGKSKQVTVEILPPDGYPSWENLDYSLTSFQQKFGKVST